MGIGRFTVEISVNMLFVIGSEILCKMVNLVGSTGGRQTVQIAGMMLVLCR